MEIFCLKGGVCKKFFLCVLIRISHFQMTSVGIVRVSNRQIRVCLTSSLVDCPLAMQAGPCLFLAVFIRVTITGDFLNAFHGQNSPTGAFEKSFCTL